MTNLSEPSKCNSRKVEKMSEQECEKRENAEKCADNLLTQKKMKSLQRAERRITKKINAIFILFVRRAGIALRHISLFVARFAAACAASCRL